MNIRLTGLSTAIACDGFTSNQPQYRNQGLIAE